MRKWLVLISLILTLSLILSACGGNGKEAESDDATVATGETKEFTINASNFEFDLKEIKVNKGDTVKITLLNKDGNHSLKINGFNEEVKADETISFVANKSGEFVYVCNIFCGAGHNDMKGTLIVQ